MAENPDKNENVTRTIWNCCCGPILSIFLTFVLFPEPKFRALALIVVAMSCSQCSGLCKELARVTSKRSHLIASRILFVLLAMSSVYAAVTLIIYNH